jgi:hypothetical protein
MSVVSVWWSRGCQHPLRPMKGKFEWCIYTEPRLQAALHEILTVVYQTVEGI